MDHKTARFWSKSEQTRKIANHPPPPSNGYVKHPKRKFAHLSTNTTLSWVLQAQFFFGEADFFSAKPTFFPRSGFFFGRRGMGVGCEATHREQRMGIQWRKLVFGFIPIRRLTKGLQPSHPRPPTFGSLPSIPSHLLHQKKRTFPIGIAFSAHHH